MRDLPTDILKNKQGVIYVIKIKMNFFHVIYVYFLYVLHVLKIYISMILKMPTML